MSRLPAAAAALAMVALLAACASPTGAGSAPSRPSASPTIAKGLANTAAPGTSGSAPSPVVVNGTVFQPLAKVPTGALSPQEAWDTHWAPGKLIPPTTQVQYGEVHGERAFAFAFPHTGCLNENPNYSPPPNLECTEWTFLNAFTGEHIESTWVEESPTR